MAYRDYPSKIPTDIEEREAFLRQLGLDHLLRVWQWFEVYQLAPYTPPYFALPPEEYLSPKEMEQFNIKNADDDDGKGGKGGKTGFKMVDFLDSTLKVFDFGDYLSTSAGEDYGLITTGRVIRTAEKMIDLLHKRGATEIAFAKECLAPAKLAAWAKAVGLGMNVFDYKPEAEDVKRLEQVYHLAVHAYEEVIQPD